MIESVGCGRFAVSKRNLGTAKKPDFPEEEGKTLRGLSKMTGIPYSTLV